jgi:uncharacterized RDD family membrane protein YckC
MDALVTSKTYFILLILLINLFYIKSFIVLKVRGSILLLLLISTSLCYYAYFDAMLFKSKGEAARSVIVAENKHMFLVYKVSAK